MRKPDSCIVVAVLSLAFYLILTAGSGGILLWSAEEFIAAVAVAAVAALASNSVLSHRYTAKALSPARWVKFLAYLPYFLWQVVKCNCDVAIRVITGSIRPGIVKIPSKQDSDLGVFLTTSSITLTPGTLSLDVDSERNIFVHWINVANEQPNTEDICARMADKVREVLR